MYSEHKGSQKLKRLSFWERGGAKALCGDETQHRGNLAEKRRAKQKRDLISVYSIIA